MCWLYSGVCLCELTYWSLTPHSTGLFGDDYRCVVRRLLKMPNECERFECAILARRRRASRELFSTLEVRDVTSRAEIPMDLCSLYWATVGQRITQRWLNYFDADWAFAETITSPISSNYPCCVFIPSRALGFPFVSLFFGFFNLTFSIGYPRIVCHFSSLPFSVTVNVNRSRF